MRQKNSTGLLMQLMPCWIKLPATRDFLALNFFCLSFIAMSMAAPAHYDTLPRTLLFSSLIKLKLTAQSNLPGNESRQIIMSRFPLAPLHFRRMMFLFHLINFQKKQRLLPRYRFSIFLKVTKTLQKPFTLPQKTICCLSRKLTCIENSREFFYHLQMYSKNGLQRTIRLPLPAAPRDMPFILESY